MNFETGIYHLATWTGNVLLPIVSGLLITTAVINYARGYHSVYSPYAYGGFICLLASGINHVLVQCAQQSAYDDPNNYSIAITAVVDWLCNTLCPVYGGFQIAIGCMKVAGMNEHIASRHSIHELRHFFGGLLCLLPSGLYHLGVNLVVKGTGGLPIHG